MVSSDAIVGTVSIDVCKPPTTIQSLIENLRTLLVTKELF